MQAAHYIFGLAVLGILAVTFRPSLSYLVNELWRRR